MLASSASFVSTSRLVMARYGTGTVPARRLISTSRWIAQKEDPNNPFARPAPPPLPPKEQREFEQLVKEKANSLQFKLPGQGEDMHPQYRGKPKPDFEGDVNPKTGEVGGPKKDPLRWETSWDYNGRCTDF